MKLRWPHGTEPEVPESDLSVWSGFARPTEYLQRRKFVRVRISLPVRLFVEEQQMSGLMVDLSEGGLRCEVTDNRPPGASTPVEVTFLVDGRPLSASARVVRTIDRPGRDPVVCLSFSGLSRADGDRLRRNVFARERQIRRERLH
jgi:c-di-GMP-binding flagellar brake protein YcgR